MNWTNTVIGTANSGTDDITTKHVERCNHGKIPIVLSVMSAQSNTKVKVFAVFLVFAVFAVSALFAALALLTVLALFTVLSSSHRYLTLALKSQNKNYLVHIC